MIIRDVRVPTGKWAHNSAPETLCQASSFPPWPSLRWRVGWPKKDIKGGLAQKEIKSLAASIHCQEHHFRFQGQKMFFRPHHVWALHADLSIRADIILQCIKLIARPHDNASLLIVIQHPPPLALALACHRLCLASQFELLDGDQWLGLNPSFYNLHINLRFNNLKLASNVFNIFPTKWISCIYMYRVVF